MTVEEYKEKLKLLEKEYDDKRLEVCKEFAFSNNPYKIGDIIEDHIGYGKILSMCFCVDLYTRIPYMSYKCQNLTKKNDG